MNELIQYVRDENGHPIGCVLATDKGHVGWSMCHEKDQFSKSRAKVIARGRAKTGEDWVEHILSISKRRIALRKFTRVLAVAPLMTQMEERARAYFKEDA